MDIESKCIMQRMGILLKLVAVSQRYSNNFTF